MKILLSTFKILPVLLLSISAFYEAQQNTLSAGSNDQSATGSVSYSVDRIFQEYQTTATEKVNAGVQQPFEIFILETDDNVVQSKIAFYPNPVKDFLTVHFNSEKLENYRYQLSDFRGKDLNKETLKV